MTPLLGLSRVTGERLELTQFTTSIHVDSFFLVTFFGLSSQNLWEHVGSPYAVFSGELWACICIVMALSGFAMWVVDPTNSDDYGDDASSRKGGNTLIILQTTRSLATDTLYTLQITQ